MRVCLTVLGALAALLGPGEGDAAPPKVTPCSFGAYSVDTDQAGLNVRSGPSRDAPVIARLPNEDAARQSAPTAFQVIGTAPGWFLIEKAWNVAEQDAPAGERPTIYKGRGWVAIGLVGFMVYDTRLMARPDDAAPEVARLPAPSRSEDNDAAFKPYKVLSCRGRWVELRGKLGHGWVRDVCGNPLTTCV